ncbi:MAG: NAD(P)H-dependent oxidoreductase [Nocardioidaceae bacterium]|nr:NAD(P)H-dependent oxidoreductase [Nocardioidaceae bacterium]
MTQRTIAVVAAGLGAPSSTRLLADRLAAGVADAATVRGLDGRTPVVEVRDVAHELTDRLLTGFATGTLAEALATVSGADGVVAVTPVFSASYNGLFKSFFDVLDEHALAGVPVLAAATGGSPRHSLALDHAVRPLFSYLGALLVPTGVYAASADWGSVEDGAALARRVERAAGELVDLVAARPARTVADPFAVTDFARLLGGQ